MSRKPPTPATMYGQYLLAILAEESVLVDGGPDTTLTDVTYALVRPVDSVDVNDINNGYAFTSVLR